MSGGDIVDGESFRLFKVELFDMAVSDTTGVYEVWWRANTLFPEASLSERLQLAERAVGELLAAGLVGLYRGTWDDLLLVAQDEQSAVLRASDTWVVPDGPTVFIRGDAPPDPDTWQSIHDSL